MSGTMPCNTPLRGSLLGRGMLKLVLVWNVKQLIRG